MKTAKTGERSYYVPSTSNWGEHVPHPPCTNPLPPGSNAIENGASATEVTRLTSVRPKTSQANALAGIRPD